MNMIQLKDTNHLLENLTTAVLMFNDELRLSSINAAGENLLSSSKRAILNTHLEELLPDFPLIDPIRRALSMGQPYTERDVHMNISPEKTVVVDCAITPLNNARRSPGVIMECLSVDRHHRLTREEDITARHQATSALIRGMAHEIKNPLGGLRGAAQLLERELDSDDLKEYTGIIINEADRLRKLIDRILGPSNAPSMDLVNIHEILEHVRSLVHAETSDCVKILQDYDPSLPNLMADKDQLIQATLNIVRNAVHAVGKDGQVTIRTRAARQCTIGNKRHKLVLRVDIIDNGPGIPEQLKETIFYPMVTGRADGTGLGLSIAQTLIQRHKGFIDFESIPGETTFTLWLPLGD